MCFEQRLIVLYNFLVMKKYKPSQEVVCVICQQQNDNAKKLSNHLSKIHNLSSRDYTINHLLNGKQPKCLECGAETRYVAFLFKKYCKEHSRIAEREAGKVGGKIKNTWCKGLTAQTDERVAKQALQRIGEGNPFFGKKHPKEIQDRIIAKKTLSHDEVLRRIALRPELTLITPVEKYKTRNDLLSFRCDMCGTEQQKTLANFERGSLCTKCFPNSKSKAELEMFDFISSLSPDAISGDRTVLEGKELDIYVPSKNVAFEHHGLYWHSEGNRDEVFDKMSHKKKMLDCASKNVRLIQVFADEWRDKPDIIKSMICHRLGMNTNRVFARNCEVVTLSSKEQKAFFNQSHVSGGSMSKVAFGLKHNDMIVAALSLRIPRHQKNYPNTIEVARFATLPFHHVVGGLSRLMSQAVTYAKNAGFENILSYVDRRFGTGAGYIACGFTQVSESNLDYYYTDYNVRYNRFKFRAQPNKPEKIVAEEAGVSKIFGCGNLIFLRKLC